MAKSVATKNDNEKVVVDFIHAAYGQSMDIDAMTALMADDFVWQLHVPLSPVIRGRGVAVTFHVTAVFEVRNGAITVWREYWDTTHVAQQLGIDPALMFAPLGD